MGFIFNGTTSQSMKIKARLTHWQASPALRNSFITIPGKAGVADFGSSVVERIITLRCNVWPQRNFAALVKVLDEMAEWLSPEHGAKQLVLDDVPDRYFTARLNEAVDCERLILSAGAFDLRFVCPDPYGYALVDETFTLSDAGLHMVERKKGNTESEPVYLLKAAIPNGGQVSIQTNEETLNIIGPLSAGETLVIDSALMTAKVTDTNGVTLRSGLPALEQLHFPRLVKGANTIVITPADATFEELKILVMSRWR